MRTSIAILTLTLLSGCAIFQPSAREANYNAPERGQIYSDGELEPASLGAPRYANGGPVGLAPCKKKSFPARDCWRRGDQHVLFPPSASTDGMPSATGGIPVSDKR
ncbi:MAG: hypothetical protein ABL957_06505 [Parvularculaceae bacterium]